jgi:hypothetical protein
MTFRGNDFMKNERTRTETLFEVRIKPPPFEGGMRGMTID